jgi:hypothetical protein
VNLDIQGNDLSALALANVEALAQYENNNPVNIPCCPTQEDISCKFSIIDGNGYPGTLTVSHTYKCK